VERAKTKPVGETGFDSLFFPELVAAEIRVFLVEDLSKSLRDPEHCSKAALTAALKAS